MVNKLLKFCFALLFATSAYANQITGEIRTANGLPVANGTLVFALNQAGIVAGDFNLVATPVNCYTSADGSVVGVPNPVLAPTAVGSTVSGTIPSGTKYVRITYVTFDGMGAVETETLPSPAATVVLSAAGRITVTAPVLQPALAEGYRVYIGTAAGTTRLQSTVTGFSNVTVTSYNGAGALVPSGNSTICDLTFNDEIIPTLTMYRVTLTARTGNVVPGFPQNWHLAGASIDVSSQYPLAATAQQTRFPTPVLANPASNAQQSVNSPVTLNDYALTAGALILPENDDPPGCLADHAVLYFNDSGALVICEDGAVLTGFTDWHDPDTDSGLFDQVLIAERAVQDPADGTFLQLYFDTALDAGVIKAYDYDAVANKPVRMLSRLNYAMGTSVAGANDLILGDGNVFSVTGTTDINCISTTGWTAGAQIILIFSGILTAQDNETCGAGYQELALAGDFTTSALDILTLIYTGSEWAELDRSVN
jgi:hypothetical protein